jgi:hypothetical protein
MIVLVSSAQMYHAKFTSWSPQVWYNSWSCVSSMLLAQISFFMSLWILLVLSLDRLLLTVFAMMRMTLKTYLVVVAGFCGFVANCALAIGNVYLTVTHDREPSNMCLFISSGLHVRYIQWTIVAYYSLLVLLLISINIAVGIFFIRRKSPGQNKRRKMNGYLVTIRVFLTAIANGICWLVLLVIWLHILMDISHDSYFMIIVEFLAVTMNAIINPAVNTFTKVKFFKRLQTISEKTRLTN